MSDRLPRQDGEIIDRNKVINFRFEGRWHSGYEGDTVSSALWANGVHLLGRSFKYHRPRSIQSMTGHDANVMVQDGSRTNMRGDTVHITEGMNLRAVNTLGGVNRDFLHYTEKLAKMMPVGFYYKAFHTPRFLFPFYENRLRKVAGLGKINTKSKPIATPKRYDYCDVLIVGSGPAGLSAAIEAANCGLKVLVVDDQSYIGGSLGYQHQLDAGADLIAQVQAHSDIEVRTNTQASGYYADHWVALVDEDRLTKLRAAAVIVAAGVYEQSAVFYNNDLPGVMLASAAQRLLHLYGIKPFQRAVIFASNSDGYRAAIDLHKAGIDIAAIVDPHPENESADLAHLAVDAGIAVHRSYIVYEATTINKVKGVQGATLCHINSQGNINTDESINITCDGIAMSLGWAPNGPLLYQAGTKFGYAEHVEQLIPTNLPEGVFAAGRVNGVFELDDQIADGRRAGLAAAAHLEKFGGQVPEPVIHQGTPPSHPYPIFEHPKNKNFVEFTYPYIYMK